LSANSKNKLSIFEPLESRTLFSIIPASAVAAVDGGADVGAVSSSPVALTGTGITGEYFVGNFQTAKVVRTDSKINFNWTSGHPDQDIPVGVFSARWTGQIEAPVTGTYTFYTKSDSATQVTVNGVVLLDNITNLIPGTKYPAIESGTISLTAGQKYAISVEYVSRGKGSPKMQLSWSAPGIKKAVVPTAALFPDTTVALPPAPLTATYYRGIRFNDAVMTRNDTDIDFDWGLGDPSPAVIPYGSRFSVIWTGQIVAPGSGTYIFETISDDGLKLSVNGQQIINNFHDHSATANYARINLTAGQIYDVQMEYFEDVVDATARLLWVPPGGTRGFVPFTAPVVPAAPADVTAAAVSSSEINLNWNDVSGETGFIVEQSTDGGLTYSPIATTTRGVTTFDNTGLTSSTGYEYEIVATNAAGDSTASAPASATTFPAIPSAVVASATVSGTTATITWNAAATASSYLVERSPNGTNSWNSVGTTTGTSLADRSIVNGTTYYYRVTASNISGSSGPSNVVSITSVPAAPTVSATVVSPTQINLAWNEVTGESGFVIQESANGTSGWTQIGSTGTGVLAFSAAGLSPSTQYFFRVIADGSGGSSAASNVVNATTSVANPTYATLTTLYGLTGAGDVYSINTTTGAAAQIGTLSFGTNAAGRDPYSSNFYYVSTGSSSIDISYWNPNDGSNTVAATNLPLSGGVAEAGFATDGTLFLTTNTGDLYAFNDDNNTIALKGNLHVGSSSLLTGDGDLAFAPNGTMYVETGSELYSVQPSAIDAGTGSGSIITATDIGPTGTPNLQIAFGQNGVLFGSDLNGQLYTVNPATGAATARGTASGVNYGDLANVPIYSDLTVSQSASTFVRNTNGSYALTVSNAGPDTNVGAITVVDTLPAGVTYVSGTGTGWTFSVNGQTVTLTYTGNVSAGASAPVATLNVAIGAGVASSVTNAVTVTSSVFETNTSNNSSSLTSNVSG
jgi:fibronectin type 3 domain-containing protein